MTAAAAVVFATVVAGVIAFQVALALGAPWGAYAMGGKIQGRYPPAMRVAAVGQALLLALAGVIVLSTAGLVLPSVSQALPWLIWLVVALSGVSVVLNAISPSAGERRIWVPVAVVMLVSSLTVAISP
jgi:cytochrome bd-type quinol oxidase subunit 2